MTWPTNVDHALTPKPKRDPWSDHDELSEDTGKAGKLIWGRQADDYFAAARAAADALRKLRRPQRDSRPERGQPEDPPKRAGREPVANLCETCNRYHTGWHVCAPEREIPAAHIPSNFTADEQARIDQHFAMTLAEREAWADKQIAKQSRVKVEPEWRTVPGACHYQMHSVTRDVWRVAYEKPLSNGTVRKYPMRQRTPKNGSYNLTFDDGVNRSIGVNVLWSLTFAEPTKQKKATGECIEMNRNELHDYDGLAEWIADNGAHIITRPK